MNRIAMLLILSTFTGCASYEHPVTPTPPPVCRDGHVFVFHSPFFAIEVEGSSC